MPDPLRRHHLVRLWPTWRDQLRAGPPQELAGALAAWLDGGRPAVARRASLADPPGLALGVALPPRGGPRRVAFVVAPAAVARADPPPLLADAAASAPARWQPRLRALDAEARRGGLRLRVHGSLAWQHLSGERYVAAGSDVDLLVEPRDRAELDRALALLAAHAAAAGPRLDGEVLFPGGLGVAWRELVRGDGRVLVKSSATVALVRADAVLGTLPEAA